MVNVLGENVSLEEEISWDRVRSSHRVGIDVVQSSLYLESSTGSVGVLG